ncbi:MAG: phasin family protein [Burkholderiaceae bacterium]
MFPLPEEFSEATKSHFEAQLAMITALTNKAFESVEKIVDLNMNVVKASLEESTVAAKQLMSAKDPQEFMALSSAQGQPGAEKALAYGRHLATIASATQAEFTRTAEAQIAETNRKVLALVDEVSKNAPAGSEQMVAMMRSALGNANAGYEQLTKTTKQAVEALESNLNNAVSQMAQVSEKSTGRAKK